MLIGERSTVLSSEHDASSRHELSARAILEDRYDRALSDSEWDSVKRDLLAYIRLLAEWDRSADSPPEASREDLSQT